MGDLVHVAGELLDDGAAGLAFDQAKHAVMRVAAHDRVAFPVADALPQLNFGGPVADRSLAGKHASRTVAGVALAPELAEHAGVDR